MSCIKYTLQPVLISLLVVKYILRRHISALLLLEPRFHMLVKAIEANRDCYHKLIVLFSSDLNC